MESKAPRRLDLDERDLANAMRHIFLLGCGCDIQKEWKTEESRAEWDVFREECIAETIRELVEDGFMCYNNTCGSVEHPELKDLGEFAD